nr:DUF5009 domain-containing protein [Sphingobacterium sp. SYP-B4668]
MNSKTLPGRLLSLDILRGFDLFLLVFFQPIFMAFFRNVDHPVIDAIRHQLSHEQWEGFRIWDLIMPLFLFMTGVSMPFALSKYVGEKEKGKCYWRILKRVLILFILGMIVQGNLLDLDVRSLRLYSNTLQAIAIGYLISAVVIMNLRWRWQISAAVILLAIYAIPMYMWGDFSPEGNFAMKVDRTILGRFMDGVSWNDSGQWTFSPHYHYTWIWSSLTFGVTVLMGAFAGAIMRLPIARLQHVRYMLLVGATCVIVGILWSSSMPIIKPIWSASMTLFSGGICMLLMGISYWVIDCRQFTYGLSWLQIYGMNSITAYVLAEVVNFRSIPQSLFFGLQPMLGDYYDPWITTCNFLLVFLILWWMFKNRIFVKI